jgi:uracil-DNA glycosylase
MDYHELNAFIAKLQSYQDFKSVTNQYTNQWANYKITISNLKNYLEKMKQIKPSVMLVGEAPGYKGCRITGIPFTAEKNLSIVYKENLLFGYENGFLVQNPKELQSESSATIVWGVLKDLNCLPLMWNTFPFHPYNEGNTESNRKPKTHELAVGKLILEYLMKMFEIKKIVGVGKVAEAIMKGLGFNVIGIRHPSMGGKEKFVEQMKKIFCL